MKGATTRPIIAVIDDDAAVRAALGRLLLSMGLSVDAYASAEEFLTNADPAEFDCLLLDVQLRGMSGLELSIYLAATHIDVPIILLTANADLVARHARAARLASTVLLKPMDVAELSAALESALSVVATS